MADDEDSHSIDKSVLGAVKKVILTTIGRALVFVLKRG